jgi:hypothetical protein
MTVLLPSPVPPRSRPGGAPAFGRFMLRHMANLVLLAAAGSFASPAEAQTAVFELIPVARYAAPGSPAAGAMTLVAADADRVVVAARHSAEGFWLYRADGEFIRHFKDPGAPLTPHAIGYLDGTLWISDANTARIIRLNGDLQVVDSISFRPPSLPAGYHRSSALSVLAEQRFLYRPRIASETLASGEVGEELLLLVTGTGEIVREVARSRLRNRLVAIRTKAGPFFSFQPFSDDPLVAISPSGRRVLHADREVGRASFLLTQLDAFGDTIMVVRRDYSPLPLDSARAASAVTGMVNHFVRSTVAGANPDSVVSAALFLPPTLPPVTGVMIGDDGVAWIRREVAVAGSVQWEVYEPSGELLGTLDLPSADVVLRVEGMEAWVARRLDGAPAALTRMMIVQSTER